eukprot:6185379-Pleurochrysis_carterae.AAC.1
MLIYRARWHADLTRSIRSRTVILTKRIPDLQSKLPALPAERALCLLPCDAAAFGHAKVLRIGSSRHNASRIQREQVAVEEAVSRELEHISHPPLDILVVRTDEAAPASEERGIDAVEPAGQRQVGSKIVATGKTNTASRRETDAESV